MVLKTFISSIDIRDNSAKDEFDIAVKMEQTKLYENHREHFKNIWEAGRIETDNIELQTTIFASLYYLISSLPALNHYGTLNQFYGLSPGSLSRGSYLTDYQGHTFWDTGNSFF